MLPYRSNRNEPCSFVKPKGLARRAEAQVPPRLIAQQKIEQPAPDPLSLHPARSDHHAQHGQIVTDRECHGRTDRTPDLVQRQIAPPQRQEQVEIPLAMGPARAKRQLVQKMAVGVTKRLAADAIAAETAPFGNLPTVAGLHVDTLLHETRCIPVLPMPRNLCACHDA